MFIETQEHHKKKKIQIMRKGVLNTKEENRLDLNRGLKSYPR